MSDEPASVGGMLATEESRHYPDGSALLMFESEAIVLVERHAAYACAKGEVCVSANLAR